jgi:hypothetical protein
VTPLTSKDLYRTKRDPRWRNTSKPQNLKTSKPQNQKDAAHHFGQRGHSKYGEENKYEITEHDTAATAALFENPAILTIELGYALVTHCKRSTIRRHSFRYYQFAPR